MNKASGYVPQSDFTVETNLDWADDVVVVQETCPSTPISPKQNKKPSIIEESKKKKIRQSILLQLQHGS